MSISAEEDVVKENVFAGLIEFSKQLDYSCNHFFRPTRQQNVTVLMNQVNLAIRDLDAIPEEKRKLKEDQAMYLYLRGKLLDVSSGYNEEAEKHLTEALNLKNDMVDAWISLGTCVWKKGDLAATKRYYQFGLEQDPNNKVLLRQLSALESKLSRVNSDVEYSDENITRSINYAKDAIAQDVHDGISWYFLGNAFLTAYFITGAWDQDMLFQSLKAYKNAMKDKKMYSTIEFSYNFSMTYKLLEDYQMALVGFVNARSMDRSTKSQQQFLNLCDVLDDIDMFLKKLNDTKRTPSLLSSLSTVDSWTKTLASVELGYSYERATIDRLSEGLNKGKAVTGKVLFSIENQSNRPLYYIVCDSDCNYFVITVYGIRNTAIKEEDQITLLDPNYHFINFEWKQKKYQFKSVRVNLLQQLRVNEAIVSLEHVVHRSMYAKFIEG